MPAEFARVTVIGVGMVGGSLGRALLVRKLAEEVVGVDASEETLAKAKALGAISSGTTSLAEGVEGAELVVLAVPVGTTLRLLSELAPLLDRPVLVSDVSSTKAHVNRKAAEVLPPIATFIGGHPMAGSEKGGIGALDEHLFENALYVLTPDNNQDQLALQKLQRLVSGLGALPVVMEAQLHDKLAAVISHLPHMAAATLVTTVAKLGDYKNELLTLAAGGFRDTTRVALGSPEMWRDICLSNPENIIPLIDSYIEDLTALRGLINAGDADGLLAEFREAREFRLQVPYKGKGILPQMFNLYVHVPDRPGIIGELASGLGTLGINIAEIELLHVREEEGGPLRLGFLSEDSRRVARTELEAQGLRVETREM